jgi:hypothetical protein
MTPTPEPAGAEPGPWLTSAEVAAELNISPTTVHRLAVNLGLTPGSGTRRYWPPDTVQRLRVAAALADAMAVPGESPKLRPAAAAVMAGPYPGSGGFVAMHATTGTLRYAATPGGAVGPWNAAVLARVPSLLAPPLEAAA